MADPTKRRHTGITWSPGIRARLFGLVAVCAAGMAAVGVASHQATGRLADHAQGIGNQQQMLKGLTQFGDAVVSAQLRLAQFVRSRDLDHLVKTEERLVAARGAIIALKGIATTDDKAQQVEKLTTALDSISSAVAAILPPAQRVGPASLQGVTATLDGASQKLHGLADDFAKNMNEPAAGAVAAHLFRALRVETQARAQPDRLKALDMGYATEDARVALAATSGGKQALSGHLGVLRAYEDAFNAWLDVASAAAGNAAVAHDVFGILAPIIRGAEAASATVAEQLLAGQKATAANLAHHLWLALCIVLAMTLALAYLLGRSITRPIADIRHAMTRLSGGEVNVAIPHADRGHEIGSMARSVVVFQQALQERARLNAEQLSSALKQSERSASLAAAAGAFSQSVGAAQARLGHVSGELSGFADRLIAVSGHLESQMQLALRASDSTASQTGSVAAAAEELSHSIGEITRQITASSGAVRGAADAGLAAEERMGALQKAASEIGTVISLINEIAGRTNLLALNATIEAARAGAAGRGFAVVAEEIKSLAGQTSRATGDIARLIDAIQDSAEAGAAGVRALSDRMQSIQVSTTTVASAVAQQDASVGEIARVTTELSNNARDATAASAEASSVSAETVEMSRAITALARSLAEAREEFDAEAQRFVSVVRAA